MNKTTLLKSAPKITLRICQNNQWYSLERDRMRLSHIPYNQRITIGNDFIETESNGIVQSTTTCFPKISFIPKPNRQYYLNFYMSGGACYLEVLRFSNKNKTGLVAEESASNHVECDKK
jgi:hypothetical protein